LDADGRHNLRSRQSVGSRIECLLRMTPDEYSTIEAQVRKLIPPERITTVFNGTPLEPRLPVEQFSATLQTEVANKDGFLRRVNRETIIRVFTVLPGESGTLYEMGIPVVETRDKGHSPSAPARDQRVDPVRTHRDRK